MGTGSLQLLGGWSIEKRTEQRTKMTQHSGTPAKTDPTRVRRDGSATSRSERRAEALGRSGATRNSSDECMARFPRIDVRIVLRSSSQSVDLTSRSTMTRSRSRQSLRGLSRRSRAGEPPDTPAGDGPPCPCRSDPRPTRRLDSGPKARSSSTRPPSRSSAEPLALRVHLDGAGFAACASPLTAHRADRGPPHVPGRRDRPGGQPRCLAGSEHVQGGEEQEAVRPARRSRLSEPRPRVSRTPGPQLAWALRGGSPSSYGRKGRLLRRWLTGRRRDGRRDTWEPNGTDVRR